MRTDERHELFGAENHREQCGRVDLRSRLNGIFSAGIVVGTECFIRQYLEEHE